MLNNISFIALLAAAATAAPFQPHQSPCQGCGKSRTPGYSDTPLTITSGGYTRSFTIQIPEGYKPYRSYPLILDFGHPIPSPKPPSRSPSTPPPEHKSSANHPQHGRGGTSATERDTSEYYDYAAASDYIIVYPQALSGTKGSAWQGPSYAPPGVDDVQFVSDLLSYLEDNFCINENRIYASGKSNGGGFVDLLACSDVGDNFAAFAMAAAALYTDNSLGSCTKKRAILESHGLADPTIPYTGGSGLGGLLPDIDEWVGWWGERDCGSSAIPSFTQMEGYEIETISCEGGLQDVVKHYRLDPPAGHCWPTIAGEDNYDDEKTPDGCGNVKVLDFTAEVLEWFGRWDLENGP